VVARLTSLVDAVMAARALSPQSGRVLLGLAGVPGSGKSTVAEALVTALGPASVGVPMDGFHLPNEVLAARGLADVKGAPETFDREGFVALLGRLRTEPGTVAAPRFDRAIEASVPDAIVVTPEHRLVVVEGNYLLHWPDAHALLDEVWLVQAASEEARVTSLVARHESFGRTPAQAREWVKRNDEANARLVASGAALADRVVSVW
jgi:pantothenate kinase